LVQSSRLGATLLEAVDTGLLVPGEIVRAAIYERIERSCQIRREEIPEKLETFHQALQHLLDAGGKAMGKMIAENLYSSLEQKSAEHDGWTLLDYVNHARKAQVSA
jgi:geranylgeranyl pyrophosphate synthase